MATLIYALNVSLDGYVDHDRMTTSPTLFRHWIENQRGLAGSIYGRVMYETMRYWDEDRPEWEPAHREFAAAWRAMPKWVVSRTLSEVGPNATLIHGDLEPAIRDIRARVEGDVTVTGPMLAHAVTQLGLIDEVRLYLHPVVLGGGKRFFAGPRPPLRLAATDRIDDDVIRLTYVPA